MTVSTEILARAASPRNASSNATAQIYDNQFFVVDCGRLEMWLWKCLDLVRIVVDAVLCNAVHDALDGLGWARGRSSWHGTETGKKGRFESTQMAAEPARGQRTDLWDHETVH